MKILAIKTNEGYLINSNGYSLNLYLFDGQTPTSTFKSNWFKISQKPTKIEHLVKSSNTNFRYELKDKDLSNKFRLVYMQSEILDEDGDYFSFFESIKGLYEYKYDEQPSKLVSIDFEWDEFLEIEIYKEPEKIFYRTVGKWGNEIHSITERNVKYDILSEILTPSILLHTQPCKLSVKESYDIVRAFVKNNINPRVAEITNDYDFCFAVSKKIPLAKPYKYEVDINDFSFSRKKKPKIEVRYQDTKKVQIFEMCHEKYQKYTPIQAFKGENQDDLKANIDAYLEELIAVINEPVCECDKCNGTGVLLNIQK